MNITLLIIGIGLGFVLAGCLMFYVLMAASRPNKLFQVARQETDKQLLEQQRRIMLATERLAAAAEGSTAAARPKAALECNCSHLPYNPQIDCPIHGLKPSLFQST